MFDKCSRGNLDALWISIPLAPSSFNRGEERFFPIHVTLIHPFLSPLNPATSILARVFGVNGARFRDTFIPLPPLEIECKYFHARVELK